MPKIGLLKRETSALLVVDYQDSLIYKVFESESMIANANKLIKGAEILGVPVVVTEQYPKGLGHTCKEIELAAGQEVLEKISFSCLLKTCSAIIGNLLSYFFNIFLAVGVSGINNRVLFLKAVI